MPCVRHRRAVCARSMATGDRREYVPCDSTYHVSAGSVSARELTGSNHGDGYKRHAFYADHAGLCHRDALLTYRYTTRQVALKAPLQKAAQATEFPYHNAELSNHLCAQHLSSVQLSDVICDTTRPATQAADRMGRIRGMGGHTAPYTCATRRRPQFMDQWL